MLAELEPLSTSVGAYAFVVWFGLLWGSFANVCIYRMPPTDEFPKGRSVVKPGSHCFACKAPIKWYDNVPLLAWLWLRGKCRACKAKFSARYLIVEAVTGALFGFAWWAFVDAGVWWGEPFDARLVRFAVAAAFCFVMVVVTFIDLDHKLILDKVTIPSMIVFYILSLVLHREWYEGLIGAGIGYGLPWLIGEIYLRLRGQDGLGLGDGKLLAVIGALLGWKGVLVSLFGGSVLGVVIGMFVLLRARRSEPDPQTETAPETEESEAEPSLMRTELPFGPFLAMAAVFYLFAESWLTIHFRLLGG
jgi:leader peptidase (prepilin peptidase) / N-methyltransferase